jgi:hypothetical protein
VVSVTDPYGRILGFLDRNLLRHNLQICENKLPDINIKDASKTNLLGSLLNLNLSQIV